MSGKLGPYLWLSIRKYYEIHFKICSTLMNFTHNPLYPSLFPILNYDYILILYSFHYISYTIKLSYTLFRMRHVIYSHLVLNKGMKRTHYGKGWIFLKCWWITAYHREYWSCTLISFCTNSLIRQKPENTREKHSKGTSRYGTRDHRMVDFAKNLMNSEMYPA